MGLSDVYINRDVAKITDSTGRQILSWTDKGVVIPAFEASGAGTKRQYDYYNLIEFGICKALFEMGQGIQSVKIILKDLRATKDLALWIEDSKAYFRDFWGRLLSRQRADREPKKPISPYWIELIQTFQKILLEDPLKAKETSGVLFYFFNPDLQRKHFIFPQIEFDSSVQMFNAIEVLYGRLTFLKGAIVLNLGEILEEINGGIKRLS
jgi:DNA-binding transcriptional MerR regulator